MAQKMLKSINDNMKSVDNRRDWFSHRFGDDLSELIVSYLSFEEKIVFQFVSKQFRRLVFNKQNSIQINSKPFVAKNNNCFNQLMKSRRNGDKHYKEMDLKVFEDVLQKCKSIVEIDINDREFENKRQVLELITKYCVHLKSIKFCFNEIPKQSLTQFGLKLGPKLKCIDFYQSEWYPNNYELNIHNNNVSKYCPNAEYVRSVRICHLIDENNISLMPKLKNLEIVFGIECKPFVKSFVKNYKNLMKTLDITFVMNNDRKSQNSLLQELPYFEGLEDLRLRFEKRQPFSQSIAEKLKKIGLKCKQLKRLTFITYSIEAKLGSKVFNSMQNFPQIQFLKLMPFNWEKGMRISSLKDCKQLTRLKLSNSLLNDEFFEGIHSYLPQLTHLNVEVEDVSNDCLKSVSKLPNLEALRILSLFENTFPSITDEGICGLMNESPKLRSILFYSYPSITRKTIDALIGKALEKPKTLFNHTFRGQDLELIMKDYQNLPNNLIIRSRY